MPKNGKHRNLYIIQYFFFYLYTICCGCCHGRTNVRVKWADWNNRK